MEESKELQSLYRLFRGVVYVGILLEFAMYIFTADQINSAGNVIKELYWRIKQFYIFKDGNLIWSKITTLGIIAITCIGTRAQKKIEFNAARQIFLPLILGGFVIVLSVWLYSQSMSMVF